MEVISVLVVPMIVEGVLELKEIDTIYYSLVSLVDLYWPGLCSGLKKAQPDCLEEKKVEPMVDRPSFSSRVIRVLEGSRNVIIS